MRSPYLDVKGGYYVSQRPLPLTLGRGLPVDLGGRTDLAVQVSQQYRVIENPDPREPWQVRTVAYRYTLWESGGPEIFSYQWHPASRGNITFPHLHLEAGAGIGRDEFHRAHLPTGRVALEDFVRLLIVDFDVVPERDDWEEALAQSRAEFDRDRSW